MEDLSGQEIRGYKLVERIGEGGFGVVYRAEQPSVDREVAIKVVLPEYANHPEFVRRFEAEARMVAKLEHPHIVPLYDYWRDEERAYLVMRWLRGGSLREVLKEGPWGVEATGQLLEQIAEALNVAHKQGVVHRDLKPENILIDEEGNAYLTDFGIAKDLGGEGLTKTGKMVGSVDYLAPEQAKGEGVTPKTDIYGLGVVLYELFVGEHPFPGLTPVQLIQRHLNQPLPSIRDARPELPEALNEIIQRATAKDPGERYADVMEMVLAYRQVLDIVEVITPPSDELQIPAFLEETDEELEVVQSVFVGRERELDILMGYLEKALAGQGQVIFVTGGAGRGKTALVDAFCRRAQKIHDGLLVANGSCNAQTGIGDPYLPFRDVFGMLTGDVERRLISGEITRDHARRLWEIMPLTIDALLGFGSSSIDVFVSGEALLERARVAIPGNVERINRLQGLIARRKSSVSDLEQSHLFEQCTNVLGNVSAHRRLLLFLDDLQWADNASISLLFHLGRRIADKSILIIGAYRPDEVALGREGDRHPLEVVVNELKRKYGDVIVDLSLEEEAERMTFVEDFLDTEPNRLSSVFRQALYEHTGGHPLFTIELLRAMQERGDIIKDDEGKWVEGPALAWDALPPRVEAVIEERIGRLEEDLREALSVASVEGEDFTAQVVAQVQEMKERRLLRELSQELEKRHRLIREQGELRVDGKILSRYRFAHHLLQRYLYNDLGSGERRLLHGEIAEILEEIFKGKTSEVAVQLAFHYGHAERTEKAVHYLTEAGYQALASYAHQEAESHFRKALNLVQIDTERAELLGGLGEALFGQTRFDEAVETFRNGIDLYQDMGSEGLDGMARLYARSARAAWCGGDVPGGLALCQEGLDAVDDAPESLELALLFHDAARAYHFNGIPDKAAEFCAKALEISKRLEIVDVQADALATFGILLGRSIDESLNSLNEAIELAERNGLLAIAGRAYNNLGVMKQIQGDMNSAKESYQRCVEIARQMGSAYSEAFTLNNIGYICLYQGNISEAEETIQRVEKLVANVADPEMLEISLAGLRTELDIFKGKWEEGLQLARVTQEKARESGDLQLLAGLGATFAIAVLEPERVIRADDWREAESALEESIDICDRLFESAGVGIRCQLSVVYARQDKLEESRRVLGEAEKIVGSQPTVWQQYSLRVSKAELAAAEKRWSEAFNAYEEAANVALRIGFRVGHLQLLRYWAEAHLARSEPTDVERAKSLLEHALSAYKEMGFSLMAELVEKRLAGLQTDATD